MLWKMWCFALQFMGRTSHKFPVYATRDVSSSIKKESMGTPKGMREGAREGRKEGGIMGRGIGKEEV